MTNTTTTTSTNPTKESTMDISTTSPRPSRRLSAASLRYAREEMDAKIASFAVLAGIPRRVREVLRDVDSEVLDEWDRANRSIRANRLAALAAFRGGVSC